MRSLRAAVALLGLVGMVGLVGLAGCQGASSSAPPPTIRSTVAASEAPTPAPVTTTTSTLPSTTVFAASAPQPSQDKAASHLVAAWQAGDRAVAAADAGPAAVAALFTQAYPAGGVQARGCSSPVAGPAACIYRILATGSLLSLTAQAGPGGWFISAAVFET